MPVQQQMSSFAKKLGTKLAQAHAETTGKPPELGRKQLRPGIRDGIAKLSSMYTKEQEKNDGVCPKGETFFRASAVVITPGDCAGAITSFTVPLCDIPAKGDSKAKSFTENWNKIRSLVETLGAESFPEPPIDPKLHPNEALAQGVRMEAWLMGNMRALTSTESLRDRPVFIYFNTRGWTPPKSATKPNPEEMVFEDWTGKAPAPPKPDPGAGVVQNPSVTQPPPGAPPPSPNGAATGRQVAPSQPMPEADQASESTDPSDVVAALVQAATDDAGSDEGKDATRELIRLAVAAGWTKEQAEEADTWQAVGEMALNAPEATPTTQTTVTNTPTIGSKWWYFRRGASGDKLADKKGNVFPAVEVEVTSLNGPGLCNVKTVKDGKDVMDLKTKKPASVRFEWLETQTPPY